MAVLLLDPQYHMGLQWQVSLQAFGRGQRKDHRVHRRSFPPTNCMRWTYLLMQTKSLQLKTMEAKTMQAKSIHTESMHSMLTQVESLQLKTREAKSIRTKSMH